VVVYCPITFGRNKTELFDPLGILYGRSSIPDLEHGFDQALLTMKTSMDPTKAGLTYDRLATIITGGIPHCHRSNLTFTCHKYLHKYY